MENAASERVADVVMHVHNLQDDSFPADLVEQLVPVETQRHRK